MKLNYNFNELIFDLLIILLSVINFYFIEDLFDNMLSNNGFVIITYSLIFLLVPMLLGVYMARLESKFKGRFMTFIKRFVWFYYIVIAISLLISAFGQLTQYTTEEAAGYEIFGVIFIFVFLVIGPICGSLLKSRETALLEGSKPYGSEMAAIVITILVTLTVLMLIIFAPLYVPHLPFKSPAANLILGFVLLIIITVICIKLSFAWEDFFNSKKVKGILHIGKSFILPIIIASIFFFLFKMEMDLLYVVDKVSECGFGCKVFTMLITGIIPFRIIMLITPPFKLLNLILGIGALVLMLVLQY